MYLDSLNCRRVQRVVTIVILTLALLSPVEPVRGDSRTGPEETCSECAAFSAAMVTLWTGTDDERLAVAGDDAWIPDELNEETGAEVMAVLQAEPDGWIRYSLLKELIWVSGDMADWIFSQYLHDGTVNERRAALSYLEVTYSDEDLPAELRDGLERWWAEPGIPGWVRADLLQVLAGFGSAPFEDDFVALLTEDDLDLAQAAVDALSRLHTPTAQEALMSVVRVGPRRLSLRAIEALAGGTQSPEVLDLLLDLSHRTDHATRVRAVRSLTRFSQDRAAQRLVAFLDEPAAEAVHAEIIWSLQGRRHPAISPALVRVVRRPSAGRGLVARAARRVLMRRAARFGDVAAPDVSFARRTFARENVAIVNIDKAAPVSRTGQNDDDAEEIGPRWVLPVGDDLGVRCWRAPDRPDPTGGAGRLARGTRVRPADRYVLSGQTWVEDEDSGCWLRADLLTPAPPPLPVGGVLEGGGLLGRFDAGGGGRLEMDVPLGVLQTTLARELDESGVLEVVVEPGDDLALVRIRLPDEPWPFLETLTGREITHRRQALAAVEEIQEGLRIDLVALLGPDHPFLSKVRIAGPR
ncbi:MAG: HEAT repeat domain-containing protein [Acidobacteriota bacterium]